MSRRQSLILEALKNYGKQNSFDLSNRISTGIGNSVPEASIRRDIQILRRQGWNISFADFYGRYTLVVSPGTESLATVNV